MKQTPQTILGLDPGFARTGFGVIRITGNQKETLDYGVINTAATQNFSARLETIYQEINEILEKHAPEIVGIEQVYFNQNITTGINVSQARGVLVLAAQQQHLNIVDVTPLQVKNTITGYGRADKKQMQEMMRMELRLKKIPAPDDAADALAVALTSYLLSQSYANIPA